MSNFVNRKECIFCRYYYESLDFVLFVFTKLLCDSSNIAVVIKDENCLIIYESKLYSCLIKSFPILQRAIDASIAEQIIGHKKVGNLDIYSSIFQNAEHFPKVFCFVISETDFLLKKYHDMQEPLRSASNFLQLLEQQDSVKNDNKAFEYVTYAMKNLRKLRSWISYVLSFSKIQNASNNSQFLLKDIIHEIQLLLRYQIESRNCVINMKDTIQPISCSKSEIMSIFKNLIENSLKHAVVEDKLIINIYKDENKSTDKFITLIFEDNGIPVDLTHKNEGLGLSIVTEITMANNGNIKNIGEQHGHYRYEIVLPI
jgi:hypothetical protein